MKIVIEKEEVLEVIKEALSTKFGMEAIEASWDSYSSGSDIKVKFKKKEANPNNLVTT